MSKNFSFKRRFLPLFLAAIIAQGATSCFDDQYVDKDISTQIQIAGSGLTIPIGYTLPIYLSDFIDLEDEDSGLSEGDDGVITIAYSDSMDQEIEKIVDGGISVSVGDIDPVSIDVETSDVTIDPISMEFSEAFEIAAEGSITLSNNSLNIDASPTPSSINGAWLSIPEGTVLSPDYNELGTDLSLGLEQSSFSVEFSNTIEATNLPDATKSINTITFEKNLSTISIDCSISNYFKAQGSLSSLEQEFMLTYPEIEIVFPSQYTIEAYEGSGSEVSVNSLTNTITITDAVSYSGEYEISFYITEYSADEGVVNNAATVQIASPVNIEVEQPIIYGTRNEVAASSPQFEMQFSSELVFDDVIVGIEDYAISADISSGSDSESSTIDISVPDEVEKIVQVGFDSSSNQVQLSISSVNLAGLSVNVDKSDDIVLVFNNFVFDDSDSAVELISDANGVSGTKVTIPGEEFISTVGYEKTLFLSEILLDDYPAQGVDPDREISIPIEVEVVSSDSDRAEEGLIQFVLSGETSMDLFNTLNYAVDGSGAANMLAISVDTPNALQVDNDNTSFSLSAVSQKIEGDAISMSIDNVSIPEQVVSINSASLKESSFITLEVELSVDDSIGDISFKEFEIALPKFLSFASSSDSNYNEYIDTQSNVITIAPNEVDDFVIEKVVGSSSRKITLPFEVVGLDLTDESYDSVIKGSGDNKTLEIAETISYSGEIAIAGGDASLDNEISGKITVSIGDMVITDVVGEFEVDVDIPSTSIDFGDDLTDDFTIEAVLTNPTIEITVTNPLDIAISLEGFVLNLFSGGELLGEPITVDDFVIPAKEADQDFRTSKFRISISGASSDDYIGVKCANLGNILKYGTPESIELTMDAGLASVDDYGLHSINIDTEYKLLMDYEVSIPLTFDSLTMSMDSEIDGLSSTFEDLADSGVDLPAIIFNVEANNSLPISLIIESILPYDVDGNSIVGFGDIISSEGVNLAANETTAFTLNLSGEDGMDTFSQLDCLTFSVKVTGENGELKSEDESQYLQIKLSVELPEGITLDLDTDL